MWLDLSPDMRQNPQDILGAFTFWIVDEVHSASGDVRLAGLQLRNCRF